MDDTELTQRLEILEKANRRFKRISLTVLIIFGSLLLMAQKAPRNRIVEAEKFVLKDAEGRDRVLIEKREGGPGIFIYDDKGVDRAALWMNGSDVGLSLTDKDGRARVSLDVLTAGPHLGLIDRAGVQRAMIYMNESPTGEFPGFAILDANGRSSWYAPPIAIAQATPVFEARTGGVCVESYPEDADVYVDGKLVGSAPTFVKLPAGEHQIEARLPNRNPWQRTIQVVADSRVVLKAYWEQWTFRPRSCPQQ